MGTILKPVHLVFNDPSSAPTKCEICPNVLPLREMHSMKWAYAMPGLRGPNAGHPAFQCADDQHFGCCHEHAFLAMLVCAFEHMDVSGEYCGRGEELQHPTLTLLKTKLEEDLQELVKEEWTEADSMRPMPTRHALR